MTRDRSGTLHGPAGEHAPSQSASEAYRERWEDDGGAPPPESAISPHERPAPSRSHQYGEGQTQRAITQDEQDRLAHSRHPAADERPGGRPRQTQRTLSP